MKLSPRLEQLVHLTPQVNRVIDVGTDHALLPIALLANNRVSKAVAVDKSPLPLAKARVNRHNAQVVDRLDLVCGDGLDAIDVQPDDVVMMAGMGGHTMREILSKTVWRGSLVLQPNRDWVMLRRWLYAQGWSNQKETVLKVGRQYFWSARWKWIGEPMNPTESQLEFGEDTWIHSPRCFQEWLAESVQRLETLPSQAVQKEKLPLFEEMQKRLTKH